MTQKAKVQSVPPQKKSEIAKVPREHTFHVDFYSSMEQKKYEGWFTATKPSLLKQAAIEGRKSEMLGGKYHDPRLPGRGVPVFANNIAEAMAFLENVLTTVPEWWNLDEISDPELLFLVYEEAGVIDPFREPKERTKADGGFVGSTGEAGSPESNEPDANAELEALVDEEI